MSPQPIVSIFNFDRQSHIVFLSPQVCQSSSSSSSKVKIIEISEIVEMPKRGDKYLSSGDK